MPDRTGAYRPLRAKLIFNQISGRPEESPHQLAEIISEMQDCNILPEVHMVRPDSRVEPVVRAAITGGTKLIVVAGGDGTVDSVAGVVASSSATLGIIPTGTRNNVALGLGIPAAIPDAVALLRKGRRLKIDIGYMRSNRAGSWFLEAASLGLLSDLFPAADDLQHGDLAQVGTLLSTFVSSTPSRVSMILDGRKRLDTSAYMVLISNMPYLGPHYQVFPDVSYNDRRLDVLVFSEMGKLDLISYAMQPGGGAEAGRVKHYRAKELMIESDPLMPVLADGFPVSSGLIKVRVHPRALAVMAGAAGTTMGEEAPK